MAGDKRLCRSGPGRLSKVIRQLRFRILVQSMENGCVPHSRRSSAILSRHVLRAPTKDERSSDRDRGASRSLRGFSSLLLRLQPPVDDASRSIQMASGGGGMKGAGSLASETNCTAPSAVISQRNG